MEEVNTQRLIAAAKEFNIGINTLIEFLISKNFNCDDFRAGTKLSGDMYSLLQINFQSDKVTRQEAEQINLAKNDSDDEKKVIKSEQMKP
jgi:translation initiation factor IF-2